MTQRRAALYLQIPAAYCRSFGGLRWAQYGEAVEFLDGPEAGRTFALAAEIAVFLQGLMARDGHCPAFGTVLHLLCLLGLGDRAAGGAGPAARMERLSRPFRALQNPLRNAGALCAWLCRDLPGVADPPDLADLVELLNGGSWIPQMVLSHPMLGSMDYAEQPPIGPDDLHAHLHSHLNEMSSEAIRHWLKFGRGPIEPPAPGAVPIPPGGAVDALDRIAERPRLAGLGGIVARLEAALRLPDRRLDRDGPQAEGYWDLTNRGQPEQILPIQFALDVEEFLRRFAERELLYFHREPPGKPSTRELLILLDQGVRTWGEVRLVLAGAAIALVRQAGRRRLSVRLATTAAADVPVDPACLSPEDLGQLLESSDLTPDPAPALQRLLDDDDEPTPRDVVLLTHPRSLLEPEVIAAAGQCDGASAMRIFAVAVDAGGEVELSELRRGRPVRVSRCRVEIPDSTASPRPAARRVHPGLRDAWRGDVEPIPLPFRSGLVAPTRPIGGIGCRLVDFDESGERLVIVGRHHQLYTCRVDGGEGEFLPRPTLGGEVINLVLGVIGVTGGFALLGRHGKLLVLAHYDLPMRTCTTRTLANVSGPLSWTYFADLHCVVCGELDAERAWSAIDLAPGGTQQRVWRAFQALDRWASRTTPYPLPAAHSDLRAAVRWSRPGQGAVQIVPETGTLLYTDPAGARRSLTPTDDGRLVLSRARIESAQQGGDVLALQIETTGFRRAVWFVSMARAAVIGTFPRTEGRAGHGWFALWRDGRRFAYRALEPAPEDRIEVRDVPGDHPPVMVTPRERLRDHDASLGRSWLLVREFERGGPRRLTSQSLILWGAGSLRVESAGPDATFARKIVAEARALPPDGELPQFDQVRFVLMVEHGSLRILVDRYNHMAVLGPGDRLVVIFYRSGDEFAAWMPDGTCLGSPRLIGGEPSPDAAERIAAALRAAEQSGEEGR